MVQEKKWKIDLIYLVSFLLSFFLSVTTKSDFVRQVFFYLILIDVLAWIFGWRKNEFTKILQKIWPSQAKEMKSLDNIQKLKIDGKETKAELLLKPSIGVFIFYSLIFLVIPIGLCALILYYIVKGAFVFSLDYLGLTIFAIALLIFGLNFTIKQAKVIVLTNNYIKLKPFLFYIFNSNIRNIIYFDDVLSIKLKLERAYVKELSHNPIITINSKNKRIKFGMMYHIPSSIETFLAHLKGNKKLKNKIEIK
jgi:hypothetical protein